MLIYGRPVRGLPRPTYALFLIALCFYVIADVYASKKELQRIEELEIQVRVLMGEYIHQVTKEVEDREVTCL